MFFVGYLEVGSELMCLFSLYLVPVVAEGGSIGVRGTVCANQYQ